MKCLVKKIDLIVKNETQSSAASQCLLSKHDCFMEKIERYEKDKRNYEQFKREKIAKHWKENVFGPLNSLFLTKRKEGAIQAGLNKKRDLFQKYLDYVQTKRVFLDTIDHVEYNKGILLV